MMIPFLQNAGNKNREILTGSLIKGTATRNSMFTRVLLFILTMLHFSSAVSQNHAATRPRSIKDSLQNCLRAARADTTKITLMNNLSNICVFSEPEASVDHARRALMLARRIGWKPGIAQSEYSIGYCYYVKADYPKALSHWSNALKLYRELSSRSDIALGLSAIGIAYKEMSNYPKALEYDLEALIIFEQLGDTNRIASVLGNIANVYLDQHDYARALEFNLRTLKIAEKTGLKKLQANTHGNIGVVYDAQSENSALSPAESGALQEKALYHYLKALNIAESLGLKQLQANTLSNIGTVYYNEYKMMNNMASDSLQRRALKFYFNALEMFEEIGDKTGIAFTLADIGRLFVHMGKADKKARARHFNEAERYLKKSLSFSREAGALLYESVTEEYYSELERARGNYREAFEHYLKHIAARDSINNDENKKAQLGAEYKYEFDKKEAVMNEQREKERALAEEKSRRQKIVSMSIGGGSLLVLIFAVFAVRSLRLTRKQKRIIELKNDETEHQKQIIENKQREILDSIHYAGRIQKALITNEKYIGKKLNDLNP